MVKSTELVVGKLVQIGNAPVSQEHLDEEDERLRELLTNPHEQEHRRKQQQKFEDRMRALVQAIPRAFRFTQAQTEAGPQGHTLVHLAFEPAPDFKPDSIDLEILRGLSGTIVIDSTRKQIVRLEAQLFRDVDFGWGILVRLNKGGNLFFDRESADGMTTNIRGFSLNATGKVLLLRNLEVHWNFDHFAYFHQPITLRSAINILTNPRISLLLPQ